MIENRGIGSEAGDGKLGDVALERPAGEQIAGDVIEPEALAELVQFLCRFHNSKILSNNLGAKTRRVNAPAVQV